MRRSASLSIMAAVLWCSGGVRPADAASVINVDFQPGPGGANHSADYSGEGALADRGNDTWNVIAPPVEGYVSEWGSGGRFSFDGSFASSALLDSTGRQTPVTLTIMKGSPAGATFAVNPDNAGAYGNIADDAKALMKDYLIAPEGSRNAVVIHNLISRRRYTLYLYGAGDQETHQTTFTVGDTSKTTSGVPVGSHRLTQGGDYVVFRDVEAVKGAVTIYYSGSGSSLDGNFNGLQLQGDWPAALPGRVGRSAR